MICCKDCEERQPGCHDRCERFAEASAAAAARKEKIRAAKSKEALATNTAVKLAVMRRRKYAK